VGCVEPLMEFRVEGTFGSIFDIVNACARHLFHEWSSSKIGHGGSSCTPKEKGMRNMSIKASC